MATPTAKDEGSDLILGWQVDAALNPRYWLTPGAQAGYQSADDLFTIPAKSMEAHTVIIAQSGSGKSFFLGRLIEEMLVATKGRILILDPNSDFRKVKELQSPALWTNAAYDLIKGQGKLPHEKSRDEFSAVWSEIPIRVRTGMRAGPGYESLQVRWRSLSMEFLAEDVIDPMLRSDLYNCHTFVKQLGELLRYKFKATGAAIDLIDEAQWVFSLVRDSSKTENDLRLALEGRYGADQILGPKAVGGPKDEMVLGDDHSGIRRSAVERLSELFINASLSISQYVDFKIQRFYFGKAREYQSAAILKTQSVEAPWRSRPGVRRLEVVDLPSLPDRSTRLLAINAVLTTEWERARTAWSDALERPAEQDVRIPTFIAIDEAHNLIPAKPRTRAEKALREQFRTLSAEGRKYGLFLILVSQRPDKLDPLVISECQNKALMKLGSKAVLKTTKRMLGLDDLEEGFLDQCLDFGTGRILFAGAWSRSPQIAFAAARRTTEGGRNLRVEHWGTAMGPATKK